jgi:O-antigen/teichoic acid export membrane protein
VSTQAFGLILFAVQAPLLGPRAFGLLALVMLFIGFCEFVVEISSTDALVSVHDIDGQHYSTMTTANAGFAAVLGLGIFLFAHQIAALFHEPELASILHWMAALPLVSALASAPNAASRRAMQFKPLAIRVLVSTFVGGVTGIVLALLHFGVWALVWQTIVQRVLNVLVLWRLVDVPFRLGFSRPHFRELWRYGGPMLLSQIMAWGSSQVPRFILGLFLGAGELGLYTLASRIYDIVLQTTLSPAFGVARIQLRDHFGDTAGLEAAVDRILRQMGLLCFPLCIGGAVVMPVLFNVWLDARWSGGVAAAQMLLLGAMPYAMHYALSAALLAMNKQPLIAVNSTVQLIATVIVVAAFAPFGLNAATAAIALRPLATAAIPMGFAQRHCGIHAGTVLRAQVPVLTAALLMGILVWAVKLVMAPHLPAALLLGLMTVTGILGYSVLIRLIMPDVAAAYVARLRRPAR